MAILKRKLFPAEKGQSIAVRELGRGSREEPRWIDKKGTAPGGTLLSQGESTSRGVGGGGEGAFQEGELSVTTAPGQLQHSWKNPDRRRRHMEGRKRYPKGKKSLLWGKKARSRSAGGVLRMPGGTQFEGILHLRYNLELGLESLP